MDKRARRVADSNEDVRLGGVVVVVELEFRIVGSNDRALLLLLVLPALRCNTNNELDPSVLPKDGSCLNTGILDVRSCGSWQD